MNEAQLKEVTQLQLDHEQSMEGLRVKLGKELAQREAEVCGVVHTVCACRGHLAVCVKKLSIPPIGMYVCTYVHLCTCTCAFNLIHFPFLLCSQLQLIFGTYIYLLHTYFQ